MENLKDLTLFEKLSAIQAEFHSPKTGYNTFGKYPFRKAEDILEALKPFITKYGVHFTVSETLINIDPPIMRSVATIWDNKNPESYQEASAIVGVDLDQKGMQTPQKYGATSSYGKKYALGNLLLIDDTQDADATNTNTKDGAAKEVSKETPKEPEILSDSMYKKAVDAIEAYKNKADKVKAAKSMIATYSMSLEQKSKFESYLK